MHPECYYFHRIIEEAAAGSQAPAALIKDVLGAFITELKLRSTSSAKKTLAALSYCIALQCVAGSLGSYVLRLESGV